MPVLTIHNLGYLFVPWLNEVEYANNAVAQGKSDISHRGFSDAELIDGLSSLITWAESGVRPDGDVVVDPAVVVDANYGCRFTRGEHVLAQPFP